MDFSQKSRPYRDLRVVLTDEQMGSLARDKPARLQLDHEKRSRREVANSNERRRMQSINSGFHRIRSLLPQSEDEKMSKSGILQQAVDYIKKLEHEKEVIIQRNAKLQDLLQSKSTTQCVPPTKRRKHSADHQHAVMSSDVVTSEESLHECDQNVSAVFAELQSLVISLREQLWCENQRRVAVEQKVDSLKTCLKRKSLPEESCNPANQQVSVPGIVDSPATNSSPNTRQVFSDDRSAVARHNLDTIVKAIIHVEGSGILADKTQATNRISERKECTGDLSHCCCTVPCHRVTKISGDSCDLTSVSVVHSTVDRPTITVTALKPSPLLVMTPGLFSSTIIRPLSNQKPS